MKKTLSILALVVLVAAVSVLGTLAYLTSTDSVQNTFTVGKVAITLDEAKVDANGAALTGDQAERVKANSYKLMPGHTYTKDPTVTVKAGSEASYIRLLVTVQFNDSQTDANVATELDSIFTGYNATTWNRVKKTVSDDNKTITYEYRYVKTDTVAAPTVDVELDPLFTGFTVPSTWTGDTLKGIGGFTINVVAQAIQADGFADAAAAWAAFSAAEAE